MSKVAILCNSFCGNFGVDRVVKWQAKNLAQKGEQVTVFTFKQEMQPPENVNIRKINIPKSFFMERFSRLLFPLSFISTTQLVHELKNFDIIYGHQYPLIYVAYLAKKKYNVKYIYYHHHLNPPEAYLGIVPQTYSRILNFLTLWSAKKADGAISISMFSRSTLLKTSGLNSEIIYDEIDTERFHPGLDGSIIREKYSLQNDPLILYVGGIAPPKRINLLIESFEFIKKKLPSAHLLIVGDVIFDDYFLRLKETCDDSVIFTGYVSDEELPYYYAACDVYSTASLWEGFNLPVVEAQACGKLVAAFDIGAHREVIKTPENGLLVSPGDTKSLADAILELLSRECLS